MINSINTIFKLQTLFSLVSSISSCKNQDTEQSNIEVAGKTNGSPVPTGWRAGSHKSAEGNMLQVYVTMEERRWWEDQFLCQRSDKEAFPSLTGSVAHSLLKFWCLIWIANVHTQQRVPAGSDVRQHSLFSFSFMEKAQFSGSYLGSMKVDFLHMGQEIQTPWIHNVPKG